MVCLTRTVKTSEDACLASARACLTMLDTLVSNAKEVYNGIVWLVMYLLQNQHSKTALTMTIQATFILPVYSLLNHLWNGSLSPKVQGLLPRSAITPKTISYYMQMRSNRKSAKRMEKMADTFTRLAEEYVRRKLSRSEKSGLQSNKRNQVHFGATGPSTNHQSSSVEN
jgi:hypothetical protein